LKGKKRSILNCATERTEINKHFAKVRSSQKNNRIKEIDGKEEKGKKVL